MTLIKKNILYFWHKLNKLKVKTYLLEAVEINLSLFSMKMAVVTRELGQYMKGSVTVV